MDDPMTEKDTRAPLDNDRILETAKRRFKTAAPTLEPWRMEAKEDFDFRSGHQWSQEDLGKLAEEMRPAITFNRVEPTIEAVAGLEIQNRQEVSYIPRETRDTGLTDVLSQIVKWVRDQCDAEDEESESFLDAITCGMGWVETSIDTLEDPEGRIMLERRDPLEMLWDPNSTKQNLADSNWFMRVQDLPYDEFCERWPDAEYDSNPEPWDQMVMDDFLLEPHDADAAREYKSIVSDPADIEKPVRVIQYQWRERQKVYRVFDPQTRNMVTIPERRFKDLEEQVSRIGAQYVKQDGYVYYEAFIAGSTVLESDYASCQTGFTFQAITGKRDRNKRNWYGIVRAMKDPSRWSNKLFSEMLEIIQSSSKGGAPMLERGAVSQPGKFEEDWANPRKVILLEDGAIANQRIMPRPQGTTPAGLDKLMQFAVSANPEITGVNLELLGLAGKVQPGILEAQRKQAGLAILARVFNALRRYRKSEGRVLLYMLRYISDNRLVRITDETGPKYIPLLKDYSAMQYDVVVDDSPNSPNMKDKVWAILSELIPTLAQMGMVPPPTMFDYMPVPAKFAEEWKNAITGADNPELQKKKQEQEQLAKAGAVAEVEETRSKATLNYAKARQAAEDTAMKATGTGKPPNVTKIGAQSGKG